jgi:hypothetical protein
LAGVPFIGRGFLHAHKVRRSQTLSSDVSFTFRPHVEESRGVGAVLETDRSTDMKLATVALLCTVLCLASALRTSGQTPTTYDTGTGHGIPPIPTVHSEPPNTLTTLAITSDYYAQPKVLVLHLFNGSGKDITGYTIVIRHKKADGTLDENGRSESMEDMLGVLITTVAGDRRDVPWLSWPCMPRR